MTKETAAVAGDRAGLSSVTAIVNALVVGLELSGLFHPMTIVFALGMVWGSAACRYLKMRAQTDGVEGLKEARKLMWELAVMLREDLDADIARCELEYEKETGQPIDATPMPTVTTGTKH